MSRGARELRLRDWPFGAVGRRLLLDALLLEDDDAIARDGWTKTDLEARAGVSPGGIDEVLAGALQLKLVEHRDGRWQRPEALPELAEPLMELVGMARALPNVVIKPIPRRPYRRRNL